MSARNDPCLSHTLCPSQWKVPMESELLTIAVVDHDTLTVDDLVKAPFPIQT